MLASRSLRIEVGTLSPWYLQQGSTAVWIQEIFIDAFDGRDDLALHQLAPSLNVIRVPSQREAMRLRRFIPTLLYGDIAFDKSVRVESWSAEIRGGSMIMAESLGADEIRQWDLCRLALDDAGTLSDLQILDDGQEPPDSSSLLRMLESLEDRSYFAIFTDLFAPEQQLTIWRHTASVQRLLASEEQRGEHRNKKTAKGVKRQGASSERRAQRSPSTARTSASLPTAAAPAVDPMAPRRRWLDQAQKSIALRLDGVRTPASALSHATPSPRLQDVTDSSEARAAYLETQRAVRQVRHSIQALREQVTRWEEQRQMLLDAESLMPRWQSLEELRSQLTEGETAESSVEELSTLHRLDEQLAALRKRLHAAKELLDTGSSSGVSKASLEAKLQPIWKLLQEADAYRAAWKSLQELPHVLPHPHLQSDGIGQAQMEAARRDLNQAAERVAALRRSLAQHQSPHTTTTAQRKTQAPAASIDAPNRTSNGSMTSDASARAESLRRQIRQLRDETRTLLGRQLLSRHALLGIGVLFSVGVAVCCYALLFPLDGAEFATGAMGVTCILAAALLKASFERTPSDQMRVQRLRIERLMAQLQELQPLSAAATRDTVASPETNLPLEQIADEIREAERAWQETLADYDLPTDCDLADAIERLSDRYQRPSTIEPPWTLSAAQRHAAEQTVAHWQQHATACLFDSDDIEVADDSDDESVGARRALETSEWQPKEWIDALQQQAAAIRATSDSHSRQHKTTHAELAELQQQLKKLKHRRRKLLERNGVDDTAELEARVQQRSRREGLSQRVEQLQVEWNTRLAEHPQGEQIRAWIENDEDLAALQGNCERQWSDAKQQLAEYQSELQAKTQTIESLSLRPAAAMGQLNGQDLQPSPVGVWDWTAALLGWMQSELPEVPEVPVTPAVELLELPAEPIQEVLEDAPVRASRIIRVASQILQRLTGERNWYLRWDEIQEPIQVEVRDTDSSTWHDLNSLTNPHQHAVILAIQFALVHCLANEGLRLPVIFSDAGGRVPDPTRLARVLCQLAERDHQVVFVTEQSTMVELFHELGVATMTIERQRLPHDSAPSRTPTVPPSLVSSALPTTSTEMRRPMSPLVPPVDLETENRAIEVGWDRASVSTFGKQSR
jgi:hypothetical protein